MASNMKERIRKDASIRELVRNVPPKDQRGARYWDKVFTSLDIRVGFMQEELDKCHAQIGRQGETIQKQATELEGARRLLSRHGIRETAAQIEKLTEDERLRLVQSVG